MKKLKLGLVAVALISGISAFATANPSKNDVDCTDQAQINRDCNGPNAECCITRVDNLIDPQSGQPVPSGTQLFKSF